MITHGDLRVDAGRREATVGGEEIQLAPKEFDLLWELLDHRGLVLTRDQLLERVWGYTFAGDTRTVDVHVRQLRRKLGDASPIVTVWGVGYKVSPGARDQRDRRAGVGSAPCSRRSASGCRCSSCGHRARGRRHHADRDPLFQRLRAVPGARRAPRTSRTASRSSTRAQSGGLRGRPGGEARARADFARRPSFEIRDRAGRDLLRRAGQPVSRREPGLPRPNLEDDRLDVGDDARPSSRRQTTHYSRSRSPVQLGNQTVGAIVVAKPKTAARAAAGSRSSSGSRIALGGRRCSSSGLLARLRVAPDRAAAARALARGRRGRGRQLRRRGAAPRAPRRDRRTCSARFEEMAERLDGVGGSASATS